MPTLPGHSVFPECVNFLAWCPGRWTWVDSQQSPLPSGFPLTSASCGGGFEERREWGEDWKEGGEQVWGFIFSAFLLWVHSKAIYVFVRVNSSPPPRSLGPGNSSLSKDLWG